jgi:hypothetical protein
MSRPLGVTASAVVAIIGSIVALLFVAGAVASLFIDGTLPKQPNGTQFFIAGAGMLAAFGAIGIWTSVGLFRLRAWARTSILVFAVFLAGCCFFSLLLIMLVPPAPDVTRSTVQSFRTAMGVTFAVPLAIAVWWLIQFNTPSTKAAFASPGAEAASARPLSITVIAWASIFAGLSCVIAILTRQPLFLFGAIPNGWIAGVIYAVLGALSLYVGKGLLDLREEARVLAIGLSGFSFLRMSAVTLVPAVRQRMLEFQGSLAQNQQTPIPFDENVLMNVGFAFTAIVSAVAIWFLIRNRGAFGRFSG